MMFLFVFCFLWVGGVSFQYDKEARQPQPQNPDNPNLGSVGAVNELIERLLPGASSDFELKIAQPKNCTGPCFSLEHGPGGKLAVTGSSAAELTAGLGFYFREFCNMTIGWKRGGGSHVFTPRSWPLVPSNGVTKRRVTPWSYIMNVCTHSYSLVWYSWSDWQHFIDWMALSGINLFLAMTGQEEIQYKVFQKFGLSDEQIRTWFNGPAFLTWSRGQNEYGNNIAGPLPRSWMKNQWQLQKDILERTRSLGMVGELPGFQGNVPVALKDIHKDSNITKQGDTGWMFSTDPLFAKIADEWMKTFINDFGTDHWYQLDGYFNGGTAPWLLRDGDNEASLPGLGPKKSALGDRFGSSASSKLEKRRGKNETTYGEVKAKLAKHVRATSVPCTWSKAQKNMYLQDCSLNCKSFSTVVEAKAACVAEISCGGVTVSAAGVPELRAGVTPKPSSTNETSYFINNEWDCREVIADPTWKILGAAAYEGLNRTDPDAFWSFQGWAIVGWNSVLQATDVKGFVDSVPRGKFVVIDMSVDGSGEWKQFNNAAFFGSRFVWTTLHDFGGTDGMKGDLARINNIPFSAMQQQKAVWGTGYTPEGIDQNPVYYEFMAERNFATEPVSDLSGHIVKRAHRRYGLQETNPDVTDAWALLVVSAYAQDLSVQDNTGIPHLPGSNSQFDQSGSVPSQVLCRTHAAWGKLLHVAESGAVSIDLEPFRYDLVNLGREILAQISTPASMNFSAAFRADPVVAEDVNKTGQYYISLLHDVDTLVATDSAFLLGPWISMARNWGVGSNDCGDPWKSCQDFYEWNARVQLTTWNPTPANVSKIPDGPIDYASKHWSGLIRDYYASRAEQLLAQALESAAAHQPLDKKVWSRAEAELAHTFQMATNSYPQTPQGDPIAISRALYSKYSSYFNSCNVVLD